MHPRVKATILKDALPFEHFMVKNLFFAEFEILLLPNALPFIVANNHPTPQCVHVEQMLSESFLFDVDPENTTPLVIKV